MRYFMLVVLLSMAGCRLFGAPPENAPNNKNNANNVNNQNNANNQNNVEPDMSNDTSETMQPVLPSPDTVDGRSEDGRIFEFRFSEGTGTQTTDITGELVMDLTDNATWIDGQNGIVVDGDGRALSRTPPEIFTEEIRRIEQFSVEIWAKPSTENQGGPARLVVISESNSLANFNVAQDYSRWIVRLRTTSSTTDYGSPDLRTPADTVKLDSPTHLFVTFDGVHLKLYVDGIVIAEDIKPGSLSIWDDTFPMSFGNEEIPSRDWAGEIYLVAAFDRAFTADEIRQHFVIGPNP